MTIPIDQDLHQEVKDFIRDTYGSKKKVTSCYRKGSWQSSRYIQVSTSLRDGDIHYEYYNGYVQLHFEGKFAGVEYKPFRNYLLETTKSNKDLKWDEWQNLVNGACILQSTINNPVELFDAFKKIIDIFDKLIENYTGCYPDLFAPQKTIDILVNRSYTLHEGDTSVFPQIDISNVGSLPFESFIIPSYQRPYKWTAKNVNQLISDIITFETENNIV